MRNFKLQVAHIELTAYCNITVVNFATLQGDVVEVDNPVGAVLLLRFFLVGSIEVDKAVEVERIAVLNNHCLGIDECDFVELNLVADELERIYLHDKRVERAELVLVVEFQHLQSHNFHLADKEVCPYLLDCNRTSAKFLAVVVDVTFCYRTCYEVHDNEQN